MNVKYFQKAFDKVLHQKLLQSVKAHDGEDNLLAKIKNWLANHKQSWHKSWLARCNDRRMT